MMRLGGVTLHRGDDESCSSVDDFTAAGAVTGDELRPERFISHCILQLSTLTKQEFAMNIFFTTVMAEETITCKQMEKRNITINQSISLLRNTNSTILKQVFKSDI